MTHHHRAWRRFALLAALLVVLQFVADRGRVPEALAGPLGVVVGAGVLGLSIFALFLGAAAELSRRAGLLVLVGGAGWMALMISLSKMAPSGGVWWASLLLALGQAGLLTACLGLGTTVASWIRDPNLLAPICVFLPFFDAFLVLTQRGWTKRIMDAAPQVLEHVAMRVPEVSAGPKSVPLEATAFIGPADLVFVALFAAMIHRFELNVRTTILWLAPVLVGYLVLVMLFGHLSIGPVSLGALPALVPIGLVVLFSNLKRLSLSVQEWIFTAFAGLLGLGLVILGSSGPA